MQIPALAVPLLLLSATTMAPPLVAQDVPKIHPTARRTIEMPAIPSEGTAIGTSVQFQVTKEEKTAKATMGSGGSLWGGEFNVFAKIAGPLDENASADPVVLGDLDGLRRATRFALGANLVHWDPQSIREKQETFCRGEFEAELPEAFKALLEKTPPADTAARHKAIADSLAGKQCVRSNIPAGHRDEYDRAGGTSWGVPILLGLTVEMGRQDVRYLDSSGTFAKEKEYPLAASFAAGFYKPTWQTYFILALRYEKSFDAGAAVQFCVPTGLGASLECRTVPRGQPTRLHPVIGRVEVRRYFSSHLGVSPRLSFDIGGRKAVGFELPVLLRQPEDKGFTSAVILGWRSKQQDPTGPDDRVYMSLVIGKTFGLALDN